MVPPAHGPKTCSTEPVCRAWIRFAARPAAPAATSRIARPPSTSSGSGSDVGLDGFSCSATPAEALVRAWRPGTTAIVVVLGRRRSRRRRSSVVVVGRRWPVGGATGRVRRRPSCRPSSPSRSRSAVRGGCRRARSSRSARRPAGDAARPCSSGPHRCGRSGRRTSRSGGPSSTASRRRPGDGVHDGGEQARRRRAS